MDQRLIAGIGNLLSDEILWRARVHPAAPVAKLGADSQAPPLRRAASRRERVARYGRIPRGPRWLTRVRDDRAAECPRCGARLRHATVAGRTACWCPREQR